MLPSLLSERAPDWSALPRGAYVGLTQAHRRGHLVARRARGRLPAARARPGLDARRRQRGPRGPGDGRLRAQPALAPAPRGRPRPPIGFPAGHEGSAFGAALLGMAALGLVDCLERAAELVRSTAVVEPDPAAAGGLRARLRPAFAGLHDALGAGVRGAPRRPRRAAGVLSRCPPGVSARGPPRRWDSRPARARGRPRRRPRSPSARRAGARRRRRAASRCRGRSAARRPGRAGSGRPWRGPDVTVAAVASPSRSPCSRSRSRAVFSPMPFAPGRPSDGSPRRAMKSGTWAGSTP